ncbi:MAG: redoxin domain-containing protein [Streptosporangiales bacterium]|nr:redoxin domain-containing protein [Streptosporangiales bacterium]
MVAVALLAVSALGVAWRAEGGRTEAPPVEVAGSPPGATFATGMTRIPVADRVPAPAVSGMTLDGERLALSDLRRHVVVVNVWGSWCVPCQEEAPALARVARDTHDSGVRFVGIDTRDTRAAARSFVRTFVIPYPSLTDPQGKIHLAFRGTIPVSAVPSTVVIDPDGRIAGRVVGQVTYEQLSGLLDEIVAERRPLPATVDRQGPE